MDTVIEICRSEHKGHSVALIFNLSSGDSYFSIPTSPTPGRLFTSQEVAQKYIDNGLKD